MTFETLLPLACAWAEEQEGRILHEGVALTPAQLEDARRVGISHPERVRLLKVGAIPMPSDPILRAAAEMTGLLSPLTCGLTLRYGIFIRTDHRDERRLLVHELVHTAQYERLGGVRPFLERYLRECLTMGYPMGALEQEAIRVETEICGGRR
jgi:hypothetical protein